MAREWNGMNWIRQERRLAIYLRDGLACVYCNASVEEETQLTLDHLIPHSKGGKNDNRNLVTACKRCNSARGNRSVLGFCKAVGEYLGESHKTIYARVLNNRKRVVNIKTAKALIAKRGSIAEVINNT